MLVIILWAGAVEVNYSAIGKAAGVYSGSSTVLVAVIIVVKRRARLSAVW